MLDERSMRNLRNAHPLLYQLLFEAGKQMDFIVADSLRGRVAQTKALMTGHSKVKFGESAHNWFPALACDLYPKPFSQNIPISKFVKLQLQIIKPLAIKMRIPIRQGIDFNMNGNLSDDRWDDLPHIELHPWRSFRKDAKPYEG